MAGEVLLVSLMLIWLCVRQRDDPSSSTSTSEQGGCVEEPGGRRGLSVADAREHLDRLSQDPIHVLKCTVSEYWHMVDVKRQGGGGGANAEANKPLNEKMLLKMIALVMLALVVTFAPTLVFGVVLVVRRGLYGFESAGDESVMTALTVASFVALFVTVVFVAHAVSSLQHGPLSLDLCTPCSIYELIVDDANFNEVLKRILRWTVVGGALVYSVEKTFEVFLLVSRSGRLAALCSRCLS